AVARGADLDGGPRGRRQVDVVISTVVQLKAVRARSCADDFALVRNIDKKVVDRTRGLTHGRIARSDNTDAVEQSHGLVHREAEVGDGRRLDLLESREPRLVDVGRKLTGHGLAPAVRDSFQVEWRVLPLKLVCEGEVQPLQLAGLAVPESGLRFARVVVAVVIEEHDLAAQFALQSPRSLELREKKSPREKAAWLLPKTNDGCSRCTHTAAESAGAGDESPPNKAWTNRLRITHVPQPIRLNQR